MGSCVISRPMMSFCWLPPESEPPVTKIDGVRTSYSLTIRSVSALAALALMRPPPPTLGACVWWPRMTFSQSGASSSIPWRCRSSGMYPTPASRISRTSQSEMSTPSRVMTPEVGSRIPITTSTSSACPLPSTPAMPTISPAWMVSEMSSSTRLPPSRRRG